jgi:nicotinate-nucleotide adenylyltransferase
VTPADLYFGGSFDPIHHGHLFAAEEALRATGSAALLFVPTGRNPLKEGAAVVSPEDRLAMVERAIRGNERFRVSEFELRNAEASYTLDTVDRLVRDGELVERPGLVIGDDLLPELPRWHRIEELLRRVRLVVISRHGVAEVRLPADAAADAVFVTNVVVPVSSRDVRSRLREGLSVRYLVPEAVYEYIRDRRLYQT